MSPNEALQKVETEITNNEERAYFWIHEVRYRYILGWIQSLALEGVLRILDVGCFPYHVGRALELLGHDVYGISSSHEPIKNKKVTVLNIEKDPFPYKADFFDVVLCGEVLEHLPQSPLLALKQMYRVTKHGGHLLLTTPNAARSISRGKLAAGLSPSYPVEDLLADEGKGTNIYHRHNREYTLKELLLLINKAGFAIAEKGYSISYTPFRRRKTPDHPLLWFGKFLNYLAMLAVPSLRDTLVVLGEKES